jgi:hypothetical protein
VAAGTSRAFRLRAWPGGGIADSRTEIDAGMLLEAAGHGRRAGFESTSLASAISSSAERDDLPNGAVNTRAWASLGPPGR